MQLPQHIKRLYQWAVQCAFTNNCDDLLVQAVPLYLSEMAPPQLRGGLNIMFQMATTIGERWDSLLACHACCASWPKPG